MAFLRMLLTWVDQEREESICTPSSLKELTRSMVPRGVMRRGKLSCKLLSYLLLKCPLTVLWPKYPHPLDTSMTRFYAILCLHDVLIFD